MRRFIIPALVGLLALCVAWLAVCKNSKELLPVSPLSTMKEIYE